MLRKDPLSELLLCMIMGYDTLELIVLHTSPRQYIPALVVGSLPNTKHIVRGGLTVSELGLRVHE